MAKELNIPLYLTVIAEAEEKIDAARLARRRVHKRIGKCFSAVRKDRGLSLRQFASKIGFSAAYISDLETGQRTWNEEKMTNFKGILDSLAQPETDQWI